MSCLGRRRLRLLVRLAAVLPALIAFRIAVLVIAPLAKLPLPMEDAALCAAWGRGREA
jgi:hypothetical protein